MKVFKTIIITIICAISLSGCKFEKKDNLYNFEKPYAGIYKAESITYGGKEITDNYLLYNIELKAEGDMNIKYHEKNNATISTKKYPYILDGENIYIKDGNNTTATYKKGKIYLFYNLNGVPYIAVFKR